MKIAKGEYLGDVEVVVDGAKLVLHVWRNPETRKVFAIDNLETFADVNFARDPYERDVGIQFADTFTGLPK